MPVFHRARHLGRLNETCYGRSVAKRGADLPTGFAMFPTQFKAVQGKENRVEGYASVFNVVDLHGDRIRPGAFKKTIGERIPTGKVKFLDSHQYDIDHTLGTVVQAVEDTHGLLFAADLSNVSSVQEKKQKMVEGHINMTSIGYDTMRDEWTRDFSTDTVFHDLTELKLFEISAVPLPANEEARILAVKAATPFGDLPLAPKAHGWEEEKAIERVRAWAGATDGLQSDEVRAKYRRAFLWHDTEKATEFGAYKHLIADIVGNHLVAVPAAILAASHLIHSASGEGASLDIDDIPHIRAHLERCYAKMRREFDDETIVAPWQTDAKASARLVIPVQFDLKALVRETVDAAMKAALGSFTPPAATPAPGGAAGPGASPSPTATDDATARLKARARSLRADILERSATR